MKGMKYNNSYNKPCLHIGLVVVVTVTMVVVRVVVPVHWSHSLQLQCLPLLLNPLTTNTQWIIIEHNLISTQNVMYCTGR